ncbi:MAG: aspartate aminotransferase family protein [Candidatus Methanodesulfokora sp.]
MLKYLNLYGSRGLEIVRGEGQYVWDSNNRKYIDCHTGHGVAFLGHRNPKIVESVREQLGRIVTLSSSYDHRLREEVADSLERITPKQYSHFYLLNSGSEAVDFALKVARKITGRKKFLSFIGAFHGRTFGALSVTWNPKYRRPFEPLLDVEFVKFNDVSAAEEAITRDVAAVIVEPIQGEGGINPASKEFMKALREMTEERDVILIVDEIQTGFGRTGNVWASDSYKVYGDIMLAGKAIGGGIPVSIAFLGDEIGNSLSEGDHGSTFGGNLLAMAAVKASINVLLEDNVPSKAEAAGLRLMKGLEGACKNLKIVRDIRGSGLMIGIDLRFDPKPVLEHLQQSGILALKAGTTVIRLLPPYLINDNDIDFIVSSLMRCLSEEDARRSYAGAPQGL